MSKRFSTTLSQIALSFVVTMAAVKPSLAQSSPDAEAHNAAGKEHFKEHRYLDAYKRFSQAAAISPEGRFYFNMCFSLNYLERFHEAIEACEQVQPNGADAKLLEKTNRVLIALRAKVPAQPDSGSIDPGNTDPGNTDPGSIDPGNTDPNNPIPPQTPVTQAGPVAVPGLDPFAGKDEGSYAWALGVGANPLVNLGVGDGYSSGLALSVFGNYMFMEKQRIGLQGSASFGTLSPDEGQDTLGIFEIGGAVYKHIRLAKRLDLTPLAGANLSFMQPDSSGEGMVGLSLRLQVGVDWSFGATSQHVLSFAPALTLYSAVADNTAVPLYAQDYGLDSGGAILAFGIAYQYRSTEAFGAGPLFTLE